MREEKITIRDVKCNYKVKGNGEPILILHGWGSSSDSWIKVQHILSEKGYSVFCPDLPGFGKSDPPLSPWTVDDYKKWAVEFMKAFNIDSFILIGHSFGGRISIKLSSEENSPVKKMILCSPAGIRVKPDFKTDIILALGGIGSTLLDIFSPKFLKDYLRGLFHFLIRKRDYVKAKGVMRETMKLVISENLFPFLSKIEVKTLLLWGKKDKMIPLRYAFVFKKEIKDSSLVVIEQSGHSINIDDPVRLAKEILKFL
ncbi:MAG: alpha/beta hydrolase [Candidatus Pacebacteria bacterium]|nr:alpha/beta hydrolase [Candidatus Paceibacterota bacterium]